jgi:hypothetical protein
MVGCCHGPPADVGIVYGAEHGLSTRITGRPLLPAQLVEATALVGFALAPVLLYSSWSRCSSPRLGLSPADSVSKFVAGAIALVVAAASGVVLSAPAESAAGSIGTR